jgi:nucleotide-binding universal stress UspA family protein
MRGRSAAVKLVRILLPISQRGTTEACAASAFGLAELFGASLEVLLPCPAPAQRLPYATELSPVYFEELIDVGKKQVEFEQRQAKHWFDTTAKAFPKVHADLLAIEGLIGLTVALRAKVADFAVLPRLGDEDGYWDIVRDTALFQSGRPLVLVPDETQGPIGETVVIAWKDAVEAVRAVTAARPFLAKAKRISLLSVSENGKDESAAAMADYLTRAGLPVEQATLLMGSRGVGEVLLEAAAGAGKGALLVMGAYGRWRWREWVFGGATHHVLRHATVPVLMMH